jgi:hypothetical protein
VPHSSWLRQTAPAVLAGVAVAGIAVLSDPDAHLGAPSESPEVGTPPRISPVPTTAGTGEPLTERDIAEIVERFKVRRMLVHPHR